MLPTPFSKGGPIYPHPFSSTLVSVLPYIPLIKPPIPHPPQPTHPLPDLPLPLPPMHAVQQLCG